MRAVVFSTVIVFMPVVILCAGLDAAEQVDASQLTTNPEKYAGRTVTTTVRFGKIITLFRGWEEQANLKQGRKIKFMAMPLAEIACYADRTQKNEEMIGSLKKGQELTISGYLKKCKMESRIKVDGDGPRRDRTVTREVKGAHVYVFIVKTIERVGEVPQGPQGRWRRPRQRP